MPPPVTFVPFSEIFDNWASALKWSMPASVMCV